LTARIATIVILALVLPGWTEPRENLIRRADNAENTDKAADDAVDQRATKEMEIGRYHIRIGNYTAALNRFKIVVTRFQASQHVEEALARIVETYLRLGLAPEAQCQAGALLRKFPNSNWAAAARDTLKSAGLEPTDDERWCLSRGPFKWRDPIGTSPSRSHSAGRAPRTAGWRRPPQARRRARRACSRGEQRNRLRSRS